MIKINKQSKEALLYAIIIAEDALEAWESNNFEPVTFIADYYKCHNYPSTDIQNWAEAVLNYWPELLDNEDNKTNEELLLDLMGALEISFSKVNYPGRGKWFIDEADPNGSLDFNKSKGIEFQVD